MVTTGANLPALGEYNQSVVLDAIRRSDGGLTRPDLAARTGLAYQTVLNAVQRLLSDGYLREVGKQSKSRGKPSVLLDLNAGARFAIGVQLDPAAVTVVVADLRGDVVDEITVETTGIPSPEGVVDEIVGSIAVLLDRAPFARERVLGVGIAAPGPIDQERGMVVDPPHLEGWRTVTLRDSISEATGFDAILEKDVSASVIAELWVADPPPDFAFVYLGTGVGIGLALDGVPRRGPDGNAGNGGTLLVELQPPDGERTADLLGHIVTPGELSRQAHRSGVLTGPVPTGPSGFEHELRPLARAARAGDEGAAVILRRAANAIASAVVSTDALVSVSAVRLGGPAWTVLGETLLPALRSALLTKGLSSSVSVETSTIGDDAAAIGAACLVLDRMLAPRTERLLKSSREVEANR
ncbi:ROK family transcriptional regulator [Leifsonia sp. McL0607]|uniref:ROK family transcriptional regulator n=1 Tax=Leifsonia sp. McL0607 TaxID=3415672 RepID=UPI003CF276B4